MSRRPPQTVNPWVLAIVLVALLGGAVVLQRALQADGQLNPQPRGASR